MIVQHQKQRHKEQRNEKDLSNNMEDHTEPHQQLQTHKDKGSKQLNIVKLAMVVHNLEPQHYGDRGVSLIGSQPGLHTQDQGQGQLALNSDSVPQGKKKKARAKLSGRAPDHDPYCYAFISQKRKTTNSA